MSETAKKETDITDEELIGYLDGRIGAVKQAEVERRAAASADVRLRLELLKRGDRRFREAFRPLLSQAPIEKLQASVASARAATRSDGAFEGTNRLFGIAITVSFMAVIILGGLTAGYFAGTRSAVVDGEGGGQASQQEMVRDWRTALAAYHALLSPETFSQLSATDQHTRTLALAGGKLELNLTPERITDGELDFQAAQILNWKKTPLVHLAYLTKSGVPLSFCIVKSSEPSRQPTLGKYGGLRMVHWVAGSHGFLLIGDIPETALKAIAIRMQRRFL
ncbi:MAG: anti-sigma factor family protein [Methyloligellaceae bacterium]